MILHRSYSFVDSQLQTEEKWELNNNFLIHSDNNGFRERVLWCDIIEVKLYSHFFDGHLTNYTCELKTRERLYQIHSMSWRNPHRLKDQRSDYTPFIEHLVISLLQRCPNCEVEIGRPFAVYVPVLLIILGMLVAVATFFLWLPFENLFVEIVRSIVLGLLSILFISYLIINHLSKLKQNKIPKRALPRVRKSKRSVEESQFG